MVEDITIYAGKEIILWLQTADGKEHKIKYDWGQKGGGKKNKGKKKEENINSLQRRIEKRENSRENKI